MIMRQYFGAVQKQLMNLICRPGLNQLQLKAITGYRSSCYLQQTDIIIIILYIHATNIKILTRARKLIQIKNFRGLQLFVVNI